MIEIISNVNEWALFLGGLFSLLSAACGAFFAVKNFINALKTKQNAELWALVMEIADKAMTEAEASKVSGEDKKSMVINAVKAGAEASGLDISGFLTQLDLYIDQTIDFVNKMNDAKN
jgi:hypothetical protein